MKWLERYPQIAEYVKKHKGQVLSGFIVLFAAMLLMNSFFMQNGKGQAVKESVLKLEEGIIELNELIPFEWDMLYTFEPGTSVQDMEEAMGIHSSLLQEAEEGMVQLIFVSDHKVICCICGVPEKLGYTFSWHETSWQEAFICIDRTAGVKFQIRHRDDGVIELEEIR